MRGLVNETRAKAQAHLMPHFTKGAAWRDDKLLVMERGEGCYVFDDEGTKYLDGLSGLFCMNLGHGRTDLSAAALKQMDTLAFYPTWGFANEPATAAATMIAEEAPGDLDEVFFVSSGSEAVESAMKFARNYHLSQGDDQRYKVIARDWAYHGTALGALAATGIPKFREPFEPMLWDGARHVRNTHGDVVPDGAPASELESVKAIEAMIIAEGPETVAAVFAEPVQNGRGALVPPQGYWQELRRICDTYGVLLVADEVINSFGRLGHFFGSLRYDVVPDMITFAKGVTSAYQPLGGVVIRKPLVEAVWDSPMGAYVHGSTFGGHRSRVRHHPGDADRRRVRTCAPLRGSSESRAREPRRTAQLCPGSPRHRLLLRNRVQARSCERHRHLRGGCCSVTERSAPRIPPRRSTARASR